MAKIANKEEIKALFADEQSLMVGGFIESGVPGELVKILLDSGAKDLTLIANDTGFDDQTSGS